MSQQFDVVILGTGPSASRIASRIADRFRVAIVDKRAIGGTCALRGCNPKKVLVRAAELRDWIERSRGELISAEKARIDWRQLIDFKRSFTDPVPEKSRESYEEKGITVFQAPARFTGESTLLIGDERIEADRIVVCTGSHPAPLDLPGEEFLTHSDEFLETDDLPQRVLFIGGGYISFEFAHVARRAGSEVRMLETDDRPLAGFEPDLVDRLTEASRELGIDVCVSTTVRSIEQNEDGSLTITAKRNGERVTFEADLVVHGAGRVPAVDELDLAAAGVEADKQGIIVNEYLQSVSNPRIYAAGDVASTGQPQLTPVANQEGRTVALNLLEGNQHTADYGPVPKAVFTVPAMASVGLLENEARESGADIDVRAGEMSDWGSVRKVGGGAAAYKILVDKSSDRILGAHLLGPQAAETINLFALAMKCGQTATDMKSVLFVFPSFAHDIRKML